MPRTHERETAPRPSQAAVWKKLGLQCVDETTEPEPKCLQIAGGHLCRWTFHRGEFQHNHLLNVYHGKRLIASAIVDEGWSESEPPYMVSVYVAPAWRRKGIATTLFAEAAQWGTPVMATAVTDDGHALVNALDVPSPPPLSLGGNPPPAPDPR